MTINQLPAVALEELEARRRTRDENEGSAEPAPVQPPESTQALRSDARREEERREEIQRLEERREAYRAQQIEQQQRQQEARRTERTEEIEQRQFERRENREDLLREVAERQQQRRLEEERREERLAELRDEQEALRARRLAMQQEEREREEERLQARREADFTEYEQARQQQVTDNQLQTNGEAANRAVLTEDEAELASRLNFSQSSLDTTNENLQNSAPVNIADTASDATDQPLAVDTLTDIAGLNSYGSESITDSLQLLRAEAEVLRQIQQTSDSNDPAVQSQLDAIEQELEDETEQQANRLQNGQPSTARLGNFIDAVS